MLNSSNNNKINNILKQKQTKNNNKLNNALLLLQRHMLIMPFE